MLLRWPFLNFSLKNMQSDQSFNRKQPSLLAIRPKLLKFFASRLFSSGLFATFDLPPSLTVSQPPLIVQFRISSRPLNRSTEDSYIRGQPRPKVNIFTNSSQKKTCVQLCLLFLLLKFSHLLTRIFEYFIPQVEANLFALSFSGHDEFKTGLLTRRSRHSTYPFQMKKLSGKTY